MISKKNIYTTVRNDEFELALKKFKEKYPETKNKSKRKIEEISKLLEITQDNFENLRNQRLFKRVIKTISGKNKNTERLNKENLIKIQKDTLFFLEELGKQSQLMMETVYFALYRIETLQIENDEIRSSLKKLIRVFKKKIKDIEEIIKKQEEEIKKIGNYLFYSSLVVLVIGISIVFYYFSRESTIILYIGIAVIVTSTSLLIYAAISKAKTKPPFDNIYIDKNNLLYIKKKRNVKPIVLSEKDAKILLSIFTFMLDNNLLSSAFIGEKTGKITIKKSEDDFILKAKKKIIFSKDQIIDLGEKIIKNYINPERSIDKMTSQIKKIIIVARGNDIKPAKKVLNTIKASYNLECEILNPKEYYNKVSEESKCPLISIGGPNYNKLTKNFHTLCKYLYDKNEQHIGFVETKRNYWLIWGNSDCINAVDIFLNNYIDNFIENAK